MDTDQDASPTCMSHADRGGMHGTIVLSYSVGSVLDGAASGRHRNDSLPGRGLSRTRVASSSPGKHELLMLAEDGSLQQCFEHVTDAAGEVLQYRFTPIAMFRCPSLLVVPH